MRVTSRSDAGAVVAGGAAAGVVATGGGGGDVVAGAVAVAGAPLVVERAIDVVVVAGRARGGATVPVASWCEPSVRWSRTTVTTSSASAASRKTSAPRREARARGGTG